MKIPPQATDVEKIILGTLIADPQTIPRAVEVLTPASFYSEKHRVICGVVYDLFRDGRQHDLTIVAEELKKRGELEKIGGVSYLASLDSTSPVNITEYCRIVHEKYLLRRLIDISTRTINEAYEDSQDTFELLDRAEQKLFDVANTGITRGYVSLRNSVLGGLQKYRDIHSGKLKPESIKTGFYDLDRILGGFKKQDLIIVAGRPSMGKSASAFSIALNIGRETPVGIFSMEMSLESVTARLICMKAEADMVNLQEGRLPTNAWQRIERAGEELSKYNIIIDDSPALTLTELRAKARRMHSEHGIKVLFVDYLQLMQSPSTRSREDEIGKISDGLKAIAKDMDIPVVALSQLNRLNEMRKNKRPMLSDLRDSGRIEQSADVVIFVHREEMYGVERYSDGTSTHNLAELIVAKHRNGGLGTTLLHFQKEYAIFKNRSVIDP
jgi:replicative DNA helicase